MTTELLKIENLSICLKNATVPLLKNINLCIYPQKVIAIIGDSGIGKTTLALHLLLLQNQQNFFIKSGKILWQGKNILKMNEKELQEYRKNKVKIIFQNSFQSLHPQKKIGPQIAEASSFKNSTDNKKLAQDFLAKINLPPEYYHYYPYQISGGQKQRVLIAIALINPPKLLIADEPSSALDKETLQIILNLLEDYKKKYKMSFLFITHRLSLFQKMNPLVYEIKNQELKKTTKIFLKKIIPVENIKNNPQALLETKNLNVEYPIGFMKKKRVLKNINFSLYKGKVLGIQGESGSGKTTLIKTLLQLLPYKGKILFKKKEIPFLTKNEWRDFKKNTAPMFQDPNGALSPRIPILKSILEGIKLYDKEFSKNWKKKIFAALEEFKLPTKILSLYPHQISGGQKQRIAFLRIYLYSPKILLLDEPTSFLDEKNQAIILEHLVSYQKKNKVAMLVVSHDKNFLKQLTSDILILDKISS